MSMGGGPLFGSGGFFGGGGSGGGGGGMSPMGSYGAWPHCGCSGCIIMLAGILLVFGGCGRQFGF